MWHDSSVLRYKCWRDWRDYMNEDINRELPTLDQWLYGHVCVRLYACVYHLLPSAISWTPVNIFNPRKIKWWTPLWQMTNLEKHLLVISTELIHDWLRM